jgi:hypothetical protein
MAFRMLNRDFKYRNAESTDVRLTFARIRREQRKAQPRTDLAAPKAGKAPSPVAPPLKALGARG